MENFEFYSPTKFIFGKDAEMNLAKMLTENGAKKVLIHYGRSSAKESGLLPKMLGLLDESKISYVELGGVEPNPKAGLVYKGIEICKKEKIDFIVAIGGGSVADSAKGIALGACYDGDFWDFFVGKEVPKAALPLGVIITLPATGSEGSNSSVITHENGNLKRGCNTDWNRPAFALMNPELTYTLPPYQTACGIVDIMSHVLERYFSPTENVSLSDNLCEAILRTMVQNAPIVMENPRDYDARANIFWAGTLAHNNVVGTGRVQDWACHKMEHELSGMYEVAHGAGLAAVIPVYMKYQLAKAPEKCAALFARLAREVWGISPTENDEIATAGAGIFAMENFFATLGMPRYFEDFGGNAKDIPELVSKVRMDPCGTLGNLNPLEPEDISNIYKMMCRP